MMGPGKFLFHAILVLSICQSSWQYNIPNLNQEGILYMNRTLQMSISNSKNQTGHHITQFAVNNTSLRLPNNWTADFRQSAKEIDGVQSVYVQGTFIVPPQHLEKESIAGKANTDSVLKPAGYKLFPGIGYYKLYNASRVAFNEALNTCYSDGGHLAIINSEEEADVVKILSLQYPTGGNFAYLGFHDRIKEGEYTTIFGQPLSSTGYIKWGPSEPTSKNSCGFFDTQALLRVMSCDSKRPFLCEIPL